MPTGSSAGQPHRLRPGTSPHALRIPPRDGHPALRITNFVLRPASRYSRFWIWPSSSESQKDFNPPEQCAAQRTLWVCPTSCVRSSSAPVFKLPGASQEHWLLSGEPGISQLPCKMCPYVPGSQTAQDSGEACVYVPPNVAFRIVSRRRRPEVRGISRLNPLARSSSCLASYLALRPCLQDSEPVWLPGPSPCDSFIRYILPAWCGLHRVLQLGLLLPSKSAVLCTGRIGTRHV